VTVELPYGWKLILMDQGDCLYESYLYNHKGGLIMHTTSTTHESAVLHARRVIHRWRTTHPHEAAFVNLLANYHPKEH